MHTFFASLILGYEMEKYALFVVMCEFMWRKKKLFGLLKDKVDLQIKFCLVLALKTCSRKGLKFLKYILILL